MSDYIKRIKVSTKFALFSIAALLIANPAVVSAQGVGAYDVEITKDYIKATGVCSCSLMTDRLHHTACFKNYCPSCHSKGTLNFEQGSASWTCPEGMWYCTQCDMDFCLVHGKEHINGSDKYLIHVKKLDIQKSPQNLQKVQAQDYEEEYIEIFVKNQKYVIKKTKLEEFKNNNFRILGL